VVTISSSSSFHATIPSLEQGPILWFGSQINKRPIAYTFQLGELGGSELVDVKWPDMRITILFPVLRQEFALAGVLIPHLLRLRLRGFRLPLPLLLLQASMAEVIN
jgi:hypothetical protein